MPPNNNHRLSPAPRRCLRGIAAVVCPPGIAAAGVSESVVTEVEALIGATPRHLRLGLTAGLITYDLAAAAIPRHRGRRASDLDTAAAERYYHSWHASSVFVRRQFAHSIKGLICVAYYETAEAKTALGYFPEQWIDRARRKRLTQHAEAIDHHRRSLYVRDPLVPSASEITQRNRDHG